MNRAVFLDRDGVINHVILKDGKPYPPATLADLVILPGVEAALLRLRKAGFRLIVVTNQPDVARGAQTRARVEEINAWLQARLPIDEFCVCYHDDKDDCNCRKPKPGLLLDAAEDRGLDLKTSFMVGDRWRDIEAGCSAGCRTVFIDLGYSERQPENPDVRVKSLAEAAEWIIQKVAQASCLS